MVGVASIHLGNACRGLGRVGIVAMAIPLLHRPVRLFRGATGALGGSGRGGSDLLGQDRDLFGRLRGDVCPGGSLSGHLGESLGQLGRAARLTPSVE